jgi:hypothetical protein
MYNTNSSPNTSMLQATPALDMEIGDQLKRHKKEEQETHGAPDVIPFTLDSAKEHIFQVYVPLSKLRDQLVATKDEPKRDKAALDSAISIIDKIHDMLVFSIPRELDKLKL